MVERIIKAVCLNGHKLGSIYPPNLRTSAWNQILTATSSWRPIEMLPRLEPFESDRTCRSFTCFQVLDYFDLFSKPKPENLMFPDVSCHHLSDLTRMRRVSPRRDLLKSAQSTPKDPHAPPELIRTRNGDGLCWWDLMFPVALRPFL